MCGYQQSRRRGGEGTFMRVYVSRLLVAGDPRERACRRVRYSIPSVRHVRPCSFALRTQPDRSVKSCLASACSPAFSLPSWGGARGSSSSGEKGEHPSRRKAGGVFSNVRKNAPGPSTKISEEITLLPYAMYDAECCSMSSMTISNPKPGTEWKKTLPN